MKKITTPAGAVFGPFRQVLVLGDRFRCDGADLPFSLAAGGLVEDWSDPLPEPGPDPKNVQAAGLAAIQQLLDATAQKYGYDHIVSAVSYQGDAIEEWAAEGAAFFAWRSACWAKAKEIQDGVLQGDPVPTVAEVLAQMPALGLPPPPEL